MAETKRIFVEWTKEDIDELLKLYLDGVPLEDLAAEIGKSYASTKAKITALRKSGMEIPYRDQKLIQAKRRQTMSTGRKKQTAFDKEYQGAVPFGHWSITKPWSRADGRREDRSN